jgi:hypothetical protein
MFTYNKVPAKIIKDELAKDISADLTNGSEFILVGEVVEFFKP